MCEVWCVCVWGGRQFSVGVYPLHCTTYMYMYKCTNYYVGHNFMKKTIKQALDFSFNTSSERPLSKLSENNKINNIIGPTEQNLCCTCVEVLLLS